MISVYGRAGLGVPLPVVAEFRELLKDWGVNKVFIRQVEKEYWAFNEDGEYLTKIIKDEN